MKAANCAAYSLLALMCTSFMCSAFAQGETSIGGESSGAGVLPQYAQCGGMSGECSQPGNGPCQDAVWGICPAGFSCNRQSQWYYQCVPTEQSGQAAAEQSGSAGQHNNGVLPNYAQCGGLSGMCGMSGQGPCQDAIWTSPACPSGYSCQKQSQWYYQCLPQGQIFPGSPSEESSTANAAPEEQSSSGNGPTPSMESSASSTGAARKLMA